MPQTTQRKGQPAAAGRNKQESAPAPAPAPKAQATPDHVYGLVSVLYHALQGAETYQRYIDDAERAGDEDLVDFFEQCRSEETERAKRAQQLLVDRTQLEEDEDEDEEDEDEEDEDEDEDEE